MDFEGSFAGAQFGMRSVFFATSALMLCGAVANWLVFRSLSRPALRRRVETEA